MQTETETEKTTTRAIRRGGRGAAAPITELLPEWERDSAIVQSGAGVFLEVGRALMRIRASGSWRVAGHSSFSDAMKALTGKGYHQARNILRAAEASERLAKQAPDLGAGRLSERALRPIAALPELVQEEALRRAEQLRQDEGAGAITSAHTAQAVAELREELGGKAARGKGEAFRDGHDSDSVGTPPAVIEAARTLMLEITFDPFSSADFNRVVKADLWLGEEDSAFEASTWDALAEHEALAHGAWWVNPPYSRASEAIQVVLPRLQAPAVDAQAEGCFLLNTDTGTEAHQALLEACQAAVLFRGRLDWWWPRADGTQHTGGGGRSSSILYYVGHRSPYAVQAAFAALGSVVTPLRPAVLEQPKKKRTKGAA